MTIIIYLIGKPGTGKYTIAKELANAGYIICDNQLINNPIFALLNYDGCSKIPEYAWNIIAKIRKHVIDFITQETANNYVLTNCLAENEGDRRLFNQVKAIAQKRGALFLPVKLLIEAEEHLKRITNPSRRERWKSIDIGDVYSSEPLLVINHPNLLQLDVTNLSAENVAEKILLFAEERKMNK